MFFGVLVGNLEFYSKEILYFLKYLRGTPIMGISPFGCGFKLQIQFDSSCTGKTWQSSYCQLSDLFLSTPLLSVGCGAWKTAETFHSHNRQFPIFHLSVSFLTSSWGQKVFLLSVSSAKFHNRTNLIFWASLSKIMTLEQSSQITTNISVFILGQIQN